MQWGSKKSSASQELKNVMLLWGLKWLKCLPVNDAVPRVLRSAVEFNFLTEAVKSGWPPVL